MHERFAIPVSSGQTPGGARIDLVGVLLGRWQDRVIDHDVNRFRQRRQVGIGQVERNRLRARPLEHPVLLGIRKPRDRVDLVVLGELDGDRERHHAAGAGDEHPLSRKCIMSHSFIVLTDQFTLVDALSRRSCGCGRADALGDALRHEWDADVFAKPGQPRGLDPPVPVALLVGLVVVAVTVQCDGRSQMYDVIEGPHPLRGGGRRQRDLRSVNLVHRSLRRSADAFPGVRHERICTASRRRPSRRCRSRSRRRTACATIPVLVVEVPAVSGLQLLDRLDSRKQRH